MTRTVVVSGSASGIGAATAKTLRRDGVEVVGIDLRDADITADLGTVEGRQQAMAAAAEAAPDAVIACAGVGGFGDRPGSTVISVNFFGAVGLLSGLRPALARSGGRALTTASNAATIQPGISMALVDACLSADEASARALADEAGAVAAYAASKLALARWIRRTATNEDWAGKGIRLNAIAPGLIRTPLVEEGLADPEVAPLIESLPIPTGAGTPEQVADLLVALLGRAGDLLCGTVVCCDGGTEALLRPDDWPAGWHPAP